MKGYKGRILHVDLSKEKIEIEYPDDIFYRKYMGGRNLALYYLLNELEANIAPISEENILVFAASVVTGAPFPGNSRYTVAAKSPLTGGYGESEASGFLGPEMKKAGFDAVIIKGKSEKPVYLYINNGEADIKEADKIWGKSTGETHEIIREDLDDNKIQIACIGPAGENLVNYACIVHEYTHINGRTGMGTVMGSKNLKAIAFKGTDKIKMDNKDAVLEEAKWFAREFKNDEINKMMYDYGTSGGVVLNDLEGLLPTKNFKYGHFEGAEKLDGRYMMEQGIMTEKHGCFACPIQCKKRSKNINKKYKNDPKYGSPEYESIAALGSNCCIDDPEVVVKANELCNKYGIDTISTGAVIAFAMECAEKGFLDPKDYGEDFKIEFGNPETLIKLIKKISFKEGELGSLLSKGVKYISEQLGDETKEFAMHTKGEELAMQEPRGKAGTGIGYAVAPTGGDHIQMEFDTQFESETNFLESMKPLGILEAVPATSFGPEKIKLFTYNQQLWGIYMVLDVCIFVGAPGHTFGIRNLVNLVKAITGWNTSAFELMKAGEKGLTMAKIFNLREGFNIEDDRLPKRLHEGIKNGSSQGDKIDEDELINAVDMYYKLMGWDEKGIPEEYKLYELGLEWLIDEVRKLRS
jgi:aldehyde:ferredoxin oxidoreductase